MEIMVIHGVLKQGNHGKILWLFETGKPWYTIHLPYIIYEKSMVYSSVPCNTTKYHGIPWYAMRFREEDIHKLDERERGGRRGRREKEEKKIERNGGERGGRRER